MTDLIDTVQELEIDDAYIELFDIELVWYNGSTRTTQTIHLIDGLENGTYNLVMPYFNGSTNVWAEYLACPIALDGVSIDSSGAISRPTLSIANVVSLARNISDYPVSSSNTAQDGETNFSGGGGYNSEADTLLNSLGITSNEQILGSKVTYRKTLRKNTYVKLESNSNPVYYAYEDKDTQQNGISTSDPVPSPKEFPTGRFIIDRVATETNLLVQFELVSPFDVEGLQIPNRYVIGKFCSWEYRGALNDDNTVKDTTKSGCTWSGGGYTVDGASTTARAADDVCAKTIQACKLRFHGGATAASNIPLPFGGFPGSRKFK